MEKILVSSCLLGVNCKYNGGNNYNEKVMNYLKDKEIIPICPEIMGGLPTPRDPSEIKNGEVLTKNGTIVTENFKRGANETLNLAKRLGAQKALLKSHSPSCGYKKIYDGTHQGVLIDGNGITADLLIKNGFSILTEKDF